MSSPSQPKKFVFITGGVVSSLGKGIASSALGALMEARGLRVGFLKLDPYVNVDPGTMSPIQHGEVFVTDDGAETDLDLGHYERFSSSTMTKRSNLTTGRIYKSVIKRERKGGYLGGTVQVVPHITDEIKRGIHAAAENCDILMVEVGGTVGDIEGLPFLEAIRQMRSDVGATNTAYAHVTFVPYLKAAGELKTKPTQHSVAELRSIGIKPDMLLCRTDDVMDVPPEMKKKIASFCDVDARDVISLPNADTIYAVPVILNGEGADARLLERLNIWSRAPQLEQWYRLLDSIRSRVDEVSVAIVGKYVDLTDAYKSLNEALQHAGYFHRTNVRLRYIDSEALESLDVAAELGGVDAILVPGGFGKRGTEGKIAAIQYARENGIPFFGICLGLQLATVEFARNVAGLKDAHSQEFKPEAEHRVIELMAEQKNLKKLGGSMRLGAYDCHLKAGSRAEAIYGTTDISERHRHRYEFANAYREPLEKAGLVLSGLSPNGNLVEMIELPSHPYYVACQFHPEFKSRPFSSHPLFRAFIGAAVAARKAKS